MCLNEEETRMPVPVKEENRNKVIRYVLKNPTQPINKIAEATDVAPASVQRYLKEFRESDNKDPRIVGITNKDLELVMKWQQLIEEKLNDPEQVARMRASEISNITSESVKRYNMLRGGNENQWWNQMQAIQVNISIGDK